MIMGLRAKNKKNKFKMYRTDFADVALFSRGTTFQITF